MRQKIQSAGALAAVAAIVALGSASLFGQTGATKAPGAAKAPTIPRTADGKPDLQGVWDFRTITPLQRPANLGDKTVLTDAETAEFERANTRNQDSREVTQLGQSNGAPTNSDLERAYNDFWWDFGKNAVSTKRTSLIIDPPDGRMPALTPEAIARGKVRASTYQRAAYGPEDRGVGERCILGFNSGPPMLPSAYNNNVQIFQTPTHVVMLNEMVHNARIVPVNGPPHVNGAIRQWVGDSRGRWDGLAIGGPPPPPTSRVRPRSPTRAPTSSSPSASVGSATTRCFMSSPWTIRPPGRSHGRPRSRCRSRTSVSMSTPATRGTTA
jgi:hypothetical protein